MDPTSDVAGTAISPAVPQVMVLYEDDSVEADFIDGVSVQLSPCGANLTICDRALSQTVMADHSHCHTQQRTQFVLSTHRRHIKTVLDFRNRFAQRPFLCQEIHGEDNIVDYYTDITQVTWPSNSDHVTSLEGGALQLVSIDDCATMTLAPNRQEFSVHFLCQIMSSDNSNSSTRTEAAPSRCHSKATKTANSNRIQKFMDVTHKLNFDLEDEVGETAKLKSNTEELSVEESVNAPFDESRGRSLKRLYLWQVQSFSVTHCPENWQYPLGLLQASSQYSAGSSSGLSEGSSRVRRTNENECPGPSEVGRKKYNSVTCSESFAERKLNSSVLPKSLPLRCPRSDIHCMSPISKAGSPPRVDYEEDQRVWLEKRRLKAFFSGGVLFRVFWKLEPALEVYPGDGSILKSLPGDGGYFTFFLRQSGCDLKEKVLSSKVLPPASIYCGTRSLSSLIQRSHRLLTHMKFIDRNSSNSSPSVCWQSTDRELPVLSRTQTHLIEECHVEGLGRFAAFSNGYIRVIFTDRTVLEFQIDISKNEDKENVPAGHLRVPRIFPDDIGQVTLPNGSESHVSLKNPESLSCYVNPSLEWASWVLLPEDQRLTANENTIHDNRKIREINQELARLQQFNSAETYHKDLLSGVKEYEAPVTYGGDFSTVEVQHVLGQTLAKIEDIENVLNSV